MVFRKSTAGAYYSRHALKRMAARGITSAEVEAVLDAPTFNFPSRHDPRRRRLISTIGTRKIAVVVVPGNDAADAVVTVWAPDEEAEDDPGP